MKQYKVKDDSKIVIAKARELVESNIFAFQLINEYNNEVVFEVNGFMGYGGVCDTKYLIEWQKECKAYNIWEYFDELDSDRYKDYAREQLTQEELSDAMEAWKYDLDIGLIYENKML